MRRSIILIVVVVACCVVPGALFASVASPDVPALVTPGAITGGPTPQLSAIGLVSNGVYVTPFDMALSLLHYDATATFGSYSMPLAFGGAENLFGGSAVQGTQFGVGGTPFYGGAYLPGKNPVSVFGFLSQTGNGGETTGTTTFPLPVVTYTPGGGPATYSYNPQQQAVTNQPRPLATANDFVQGLFGAGSFQAGAGLLVNIVDNALALNNKTTAVTNYYNTTPTAAPTLAVDNTVTTVNTNMVSGGTASSADIALGIPLLLKTGSVSHYITAGFEIYSADGSSSQTVTTTTPVNPADPGGNYTNTSSSVVAKGSAYNIPVGYALILPPLIGGSKKNQFIVTADTAFNIATRQSSTVNTSNLYTYTGGGATAVASTATDNEDTTAYGTAVSFKVGAGAVHSLYFTPTQGVEYGIVPALYVDYMQYTGATPLGTGSAAPPLTSDTTVVKTDTDNNGLFTDPTDVVTTTTTTYTNAASDTAGITTTNQVDVVFSVPMILKIMPQGWIFGFTLGTTPQAWYNLQLASTASRTKTVTSSASTGGGTPVVTTTQFAPSAPGSTVTNIWSFQAVHTLGLNFVFDKVTLDVLLTAKTVAPGGNAVSSLFDFNNLTIQAAVPLG